MSDLNRPDEKDGVDDLREVESSEERMRQEVGLDTQDDDAGRTERPTGPPTHRTPPPPD